MPSVKDDKRALDIAINNPESQAAPAILQKLGLDQTDLKAGIIAKQLESQDPKDPRIPQIRNKIFQKVAQARPSQDPGFFGGGSISRIVSKNVIDQNPKVQEQYYKNKGFETRFVKDNLEIRGPDETQFSPVDPEGVDLFDAFDVIGEVLEGVAAGVAGVGGAIVGGGLGSAAGPVGTVAGAGTGALLAAGATTAAFENARQTVSGILGAREERDVGAIVQAGLLGAGGEVLGGGAGLLLRGAGKGISKVVSKFSAGLKKSSPEIEAAAKELGVTPTAGQLSESPILQQLESAQAQSSGLLGGFSLRKQIEKNQKTLQDVADNIVTDASQKSAFDVGDLAGKQLSEGLRKKLESAEVLYNKYESIFKLKAYKPDLGPIKKRMSELKSDLEFDPPGLRLVESFEKRLDNVTNLNKLKLFRSAIGKELGRDTKDVTKASILGRLYGPITEARSKTLLDLSKQRGGDFFDTAKKEIELADKIYKGAVNDVVTVVKRPGDVLKTSPKKGLKEFLKTPEIERINKILKSNDPAKIAAVQKAFPEAFETLRAGKIDEIAKASTKGAEIVPRTLAKKINALPPETIHLIFGPHAEKKAKAITLFLEATPKMVGGSGTTQARRFFGESAGIKFPGYAYVMRQLASVSRDFSLNVRAKAMGVEDNILTKIGKWFKESPIPTAATIVSGRQGLFDKPMDQSPRFGTKVQQQTPILGR